MIKHTHEQYSPEWWAARRGVPSASNYGKIITPKGWKIAVGAQTYADTLVAEKYDPLYGVDTERYASKEMRAGTLAEPKHREWYELTRDVEVEEVGFCTTDAISEHTLFGCSPDGLVGDDGGLEIKRPQPHTQVKYLREGGVPAEYLPQVHGSLAVTGRKWWDFLSLCPGLPPLLVRVEPDEKTEQLIEALQSFGELLSQTRMAIKKMENK